MIKKLKMAKKSKKKLKRSGGKVKSIEAKIPEAPAYVKSVGKLTQIIKVNCPQRIVNCVVGSKATGKTYETKKVIKRYIKKFPKEKVLIIDPNSEYIEYPTTTIEKITDLKKPSRISLLGMDTDRRKKLFQYIAWNYKNGLLVVEDYYALFPSLKDSFEFIGAISCCRSKNIDVILTFQSLSSVPIKFIQNTFAFRFHHTMENIGCVKINVIDAYLCGNPYGKVPIDYVNIEYYEGNRFNHVYFDVVNQRIIGVKNQESLFEACTEFYRPTINQLAKQLING